MRYTFLLKINKLSVYVTGDSRNTSFVKLILKNTKRKGVDIVLNSLTGKLFEASITCLAVRGRFLELGKVDFVRRTNIDSSMFLKNCSFHGIFIDDLFHAPSREQIKLQKTVAEGM